MAAGVGSGLHHSSHLCLDLFGTLVLRAGFPAAGLLPTHRYTFKVAGNIIGRSVYFVYCLELL
jgi:hypothetical protein